MKEENGAAILLLLCPRQFSAPSQTNNQESILIPHTYNKQQEQDYLLILPGDRDQLRDGREPEAWDIKGPAAGTQTQGARSFSGRQLLAPDQGSVVRDPPAWRGSRPKEGTPSSIRAFSTILLLFLLAIFSFSFSSASSPVVCSCS